MNTQGKVATMPKQDDERSKATEANRSTSRHLRTDRREKRFEFGFFIRKVVNGWVKFYKQFPEKDRAAVFALVRGKKVEKDASSEAGENQSAALSDAGPGDFSGGTIEKQSGTGGGTGDGGPIGGTRVDVGFYAAVTTETTSDDGSEET